MHDSERPGTHVSRRELLLTPTTVQLIQSGVISSDSTTGTVTFDTEFLTAPDVVLVGSWDGAAVREFVIDRDTGQGITTTDFDWYHDAGGGDPHYGYWIAVGTVHP